MLFLCLLACRSSFPCISSFLPLPSARCCTPPLPPVSFGRSRAVAFRRKDWRARQDDSKRSRSVTFREPAAAMRACVDPSPVIDGRRANCNLASLGAHRSMPSTPPHAFPSPSSFPHYAIQQGAPYGLYGYYNVYGGATAQYPVHGSAAGMVTGTTAFYPYFQLGHDGGAAVGHGYSIPYPPMLHYSTVASTAGLTGFMQHLGGPLSIPPSPPAQPGMTVALTAPALPSPAGYHYGLFTAPEQPLA
ncbi:hypothetical protein B296_00018486 [Ensete ventricosum]|uniref:Uncharacterized protein n=1 Tax=Ensete ventricosum TaxID=4639 RepID=A0A427A5V1_ENSVE|nr:hypothetical protein B296_00018486 [Ensete ventricosum]